MALPTTPHSSEEAPNLSIPQTPPEARLESPPLMQINPTASEPAVEKTQEQHTESRDAQASQKEETKAIESGELNKNAGADGKEGFLDEAIAKLRQTLRGRKSKPTSVPQVRDELSVQIENIMAEGLTDAYSELTPVQQQEFKIKGEQTAWKIRVLLKQTKIKIKKIFQLLLEWLKLLPGINRLFLEQEAKIKADKIITLHNSKRE